LTTIAYKDGVVAADSQRSSGYIRVGETVKIVQNAAGDIAGGCGSDAFCAAFQEWFLGGEQTEMAKPETEEGSSGRGIIFRANGWIEELDGDGWSKIIATLYAVGSGRELAMGAMAFGATPEEAIAVAAEYDVYTGGRVVSLRHPPS